LIIGPYDQSENSIYGQRMLIWLVYGSEGGGLIMSPFMTLHLQWIRQHGSRNDTSNISHYTHTKKKYKKQDDVGGLIEYAQSGLYLLFLDRVFILILVFVIILFFFVSAFRIGYHLCFFLSLRYAGRLGKLEDGTKTERCMSCFFLIRVRLEADGRTDPDKATSLIRPSSFKSNFRMSLWFFNHCFCCKTSLFGLGITFFLSEPWKVIQSYDAKFCIGSKILGCSVCSGRFDKGSGEQYWPYNLF